MRGSADCAPTRIDDVPASAPRATTAKRDPTCAAVHLWLHPCGHSINRDACLTDIVGGEPTGRAAAGGVPGRLPGAWPLWEAWWPRRSDAHRRARWPVNLSLAVVNAVIVRVLAPASGVTFALLAERPRAGAAARGGAAGGARMGDGGAGAGRGGLPPAPPVPCRAAAVAAAPAASRRPRLRLHHRRALPPRRDRALHPLQGRVASSRWARRRRPRSRSRSSSARVALLPRQRARGRRPVLAAGCSSRPTCTACTTPPTAPSRTPTSASASRGGTGSGAPTGRRRASRTRPCRSGIEAPRP